MRAQKPRMEISKGNPTKIMAEKGHLSGVRAGNALSVRGMLRWERGTEALIPIGDSLRWPGRHVTAGRNLELPDQAVPYPALVSPQRPRETPEPDGANMLGADLRRPRRRLSTGPGLGWAEPEPLDPGVPLLHRPTTLPLLIPPRISITKADR